MIRILSRLFRLRLALLNGVAATGGYLLYPIAAETASIYAALFGVAFLAAGGSALNQVQERDMDILMVRTRRRPLPGGDLTPVVAAALGGFSILAGLVILAAAGGLPPVIIGCATLAWYLSIYTPLKRHTQFALPVGAICGALPPLIGWCIAGGDPTDYRIMLLAGLLFLWQIPHFWLFQRRHEDDYRRAGIPLFGNSVKGAGLIGYCRLWIYALFAGAMLLPAFGIIERQFAVWYAAFPLSLLIMSAFRSESALFSYLNLFPLLVTVFLFIQK